MKPQIVCAPIRGKEHCNVREFDLSAVYVHNPNHRAFGLWIGHMFSELTYFFCAIAPMVGVVNVGSTSHFLVGLMGPPRLYREPRSSSPTGAPRGYSPLPLLWDFLTESATYRDNLEQAKKVPCTRCVASNDPSS